MPLIIALCVMLAGCSKISSDFPDDVQTTTADEAASSSETSSAPVSETPTEAQTEVTTAQKLAVPDYGIEHKSFQKAIEAEHAGLKGGASASSKKGKFSGDGYASGFAKSTDSAAVFTVELPSTQHYDISLYIRAEENARAYVTAGGEKYELSLPATEEFYIYKLDMICLEAGECEITVSGGFNAFELDKIALSDCKTVYEYDFDTDDEPICSDASTEARELYELLLDSFGKKCVSGQYASSDKNIEAKLIYSVTGRYPLLRLGDLGAEDDEIAASIDWAAKGGMVSLMWYWNAPLGEPDVYIDNTDFDMKAAVTDKSIATLPVAELEKLYVSGEISRECLFLVRDIDSAAERLAVLRDKNIPVLWRPLHEADSGLYWWGQDAQAYKWLWKLMYDRMTGLHKLNNLLWVWNGTSAEYYVGNDSCDLASADSYTTSPKRKTACGSFLTLYGLTGGKKLLALSETGTLPEPGLLSREKCVWSFFGLWYGDYLMTSAGKLNEDNITREQLYAAYNSELLLTLP